MADIINVVNTVRANSELLMERIPEATKTNLAVFYDALKVDPVMMNTFLFELVDKVITTSVIKKKFVNPLSIFKKGNYPLGMFHEQTHTNPVKAEKYDRNATTLLTVREPDVASEYFRMNRQDKYPITINEPLIAHAFTSWEKLGEQIEAIKSALYTGEQIDEWTLMKNLFSNALTEGKLITAESDLTTTDGAKALVKNIRNYSRLMLQPSEKFNAYNKLNPTKSQRVTWSEAEDIVLILRSDIQTDIDFDFLSGIYNLEKVENRIRIVEVSDFGMDPTIQAVLCDVSFLKIDDNLNKLASFDNPETLNLTYFLHIWQTMGLSYFANHLAFVDPVVTP